MQVRTWLGVLGAAALFGWGYTWHVQSMGRLEGEIAARGQSIRQLGKLAAEKRAGYAKAKVAFLAKPSLESCSVVLSSCEQMHQADSSQIAFLTKQIDAQKKLHNKGKLLGIIPRPVVIVGGCIGQQLHPELCLAGGIPITH